MEILAKLLGGKSRVKIMRLFLFNKGESFDLKDIASHSIVPTPSARKEISFLSGIKFLKEVSIIKEEIKNKGKKTIVKKKKVRGWSLDNGFPYIDSLSDLMIDSKFSEKEEITKRFRGTGNIKLLIISGVLIKDTNTEIDILIVGDSLKRTKIESSLRAIESEIGKELRYSILDTKEFNYRLDMYDKFIRNILDYPHQRIIEKIRID